MKIKNIANNVITSYWTSKTYTIQYGDSWLNDYLVYTEWLDVEGKVIDCTLVDQKGETITDEALIDSVHEYVDNLEE
jgi:hypothetical protein